MPRHADLRGAEPNIACTAVLRSEKIKKRRRKRRKRRRKEERTKGPKVVKVPAKNAFTRRRLGQVIF